MLRIRGERFGRHGHAASPGTLGVMPGVHALAHAERMEFADLLDELTPSQWSSPSPCIGWSVQDVAAHTIAYLDQSRGRLAVNMLRSGWNVDRLNARALRRYVDVSPDQLTNTMRQNSTPSGAGALFGGRVALIECLVHQQDVRRALGKPRAIPEARLRVSLGFARVSPVIAGARRTRGVRLVATDVDWSAGGGPDVRGPAESLLMAMTGRIDIVHDELFGDGVTVLASRHLRR